MELENEYTKHTCCEHLQLSAKEDDYINDLSEVFMRMVRKVYRSKGLSEELIDKNAIQDIFNVLWNGVQRGFGDVETDFENPNEKMIQALKNNVWEFSIAKNHNDLIAINNMLVDDKGNLRNWNDFKRAVEPITGRSIRYLKTEYRTAVSSATMVAKWQKLQAEKHIIPYAKFFVVNDPHTTDICRPLDGVVVPIDHPILKQYFPPNHWNCRTNVVGTRYDKPTPEEKIKLPIIPDRFMTNVGIAGKIFKEDHTYTKQLLSVISRNQLETIKYELAKQDDFYIVRHTTKDGGQLRENIHTDKSDYIANFHIGKLITEYEKDGIIDLLPHSFEIGVKNPELRVREIIGDITNRSGNVKNFISNSFSNKLKKNGQLVKLDKTFLALNFGTINRLSKKEFKAILGTLFDKMKYNESVKFVYIIYNNKVIKVDRWLVIKEEHDYLRKVLQPLKNHTGV